MRYYVRECVLAGASHSQSACPALVDGPHEAVTTMSPLRGSDCAERGRVGDVACNVYTIIAAP